MSYLAKIANLSTYKTRQIAHPYRVGCLFVYVRVFGDTLQDMDGNPLLFFVKLPFIGCLLGKIISQKMKSMFPKNITIVVIMLLSLSFQSVYSQTKKNQQSFVTTDMARKISYSCQYNERMRWFFANANNINFSDEADRILRTLDKHLDYAEKYLIALYYNYGTRMGYFALKNMGFTIKETERVEVVWEQEEAKQEAIANKKRQEEEQALLKRIEADDIFTEDILSIKPNIEIDIAELAISPVTNNKNERFDYYYRCIIDKEGKLSLANFSDTLNYSVMQKFIYDYITNENIYKAGCIEIEGRHIPVNSYVNIEFKEQRYEHRGYLDLSIKKDKKTNRWEILPNNSTDLMHWTCEDPEVLKLDLENAIYNCPQLQEKKGKMQLKIYVYERVLSSNISDKIELSHYFEMTYRSGSFGRYGEYIPLEYKISF